MDINLSSLQQKVNRLLHNTYEITKKWLDIVSDNPKDVQIQYYDENSNLKTETIPNYGKLKNNVKQAISDTQRIIPINPNLLKNTRSFYWSKDEIGTIDPFQKKYGKYENQWFDNKLPMFYSWSNYSSDSNLSFRAKTIHVWNQDAWKDEGLPDPLQIGLIHRASSSEPYYGAHLARAFIIDMERTKAPSDNCGAALLDQDCVSYTSWTVGNFYTTFKVYIAVLHREGDIKFIWNNRAPRIEIDYNIQNKWQHITVYKVGFGGCMQGYIYGTGKLKLAIMFPYFTVGKLPEDVHAWAGFIGYDGPYTHNDIIIDSGAEILVKT